MTRTPTPKIDGRDAGAIADALRVGLFENLDAARAARAARDPAATDDPAVAPAGGDLDGPERALVPVVAHLASIVVDRIDRTPDKAFLSFLDLVGVAPRPPQPARVPLTFSLAQGAAAGARVPRGTRVAAMPAQDEAEPPVFETADDLFLTGAELLFACQHDEAADTWSDLSGVVAASPADAAPGAAAFAGQPIARRLWIAHPLLSGGGAGTGRFRLTGPAPGEVDWGWWDGAVRHALDGDGGSPSVPVVAAAARDGRAGPMGAWLVGVPRPPAPGAEPTPLASIAAEVRFELEASADSLLPDAVLAGTAPLDVTKHFLPFGATPRLGDACLISCEAAFAPRGPGGTQIIRLLFAGGVEGPAGVTLAWDYWRGDGWGSIGTSSTGDADHPDAEFRLAASSPSDAALFAAAGEGEDAVVFARPSGWARLAVGGVEGYWLRVRVARGGYGQDAAYRAVKTAAGQTTYAVDPPTWRPPSFESLTCGCRYASPPVGPERALLEMPYGFGEVDAPPPAGDAAGGPALHLAFGRPGPGPAFGNGSVSLFVGIDEIAGDGRAAGAAGADPAHPSMPPVVRWDYFDARGRWSRLAVEDGTAALTRSGTVAFVGPADLAPGCLFGRTACWLRATHEAGDYPAALRVARLAVDTVWAEQSTRIASETLGSGAAEPGQTFRVGHPPVLAGQAVEVAEAEPPGAAGLADLVAEEGPDCVTVELDGGGQALRTWVRWHEVPDFYGSAAGDRHYTVNRLTGTVAFGGGGHGRALPRGTENVRISYATGGGSAGNRDAGTVTQLKSALPYVGAVSNPVPAAGGEDAEGLDAMLRRGPRTLRHRGRAVTISDYEDLAFEASPAVARVRGIGARGDTVPGRVELIVVPRSAAARPAAGLPLLQEVRDALAAVAPPTVDIAVRGPAWVSVSVSAEVVPVSVDRAAAVREGVETRLRAFLHPLTGGLDGSGWAFGRSPHRSDLYAVVAGVPGVDHVRALSVACDPAWDRAGEHALMCPGAIEVRLGGTDGGATGTGSGA